MGGRGCDSPEGRVEREGGRGCDSAEGRVEWEGGGVTLQRGGSSGREGV